MRVQQILDQRPDLWRGQASRHVLPVGIPTDVPLLDARLVWGGWPPSGLIELLSDRPGEGFAIVLPALARLSREQSRWLLLAEPPFQPFAPALAARGLRLERLIVVTAGADRAWAAEQGLRSGACAAVLVWGGRWEAPALRRLHLAAETSGALAVLFREEEAARAPSPAVLRLRIRPSPRGPEPWVLKQRGGRAD
jgi:protein ImuA